MVAAADSKRRRLSSFSRSFCGDSARNVRAIGLPLRALAFDKGAGQHFAERTEAADEFAAQFQVGIGGLFHLTLILVSESGQVKPRRRFARMPAKLRQTELEGETP